MYFTWRHKKCDYPFIIYKTAVRCNLLLSNSGQVATLNTRSNLPSSSGYAGDIQKLHLMAYIRNQTRFFIILSSIYHTGNAYGLTSSICISSMIYAGRKYQKRVWFQFIHMHFQYDICWKELSKTRLISIHPYAFPIWYMLERMIKNAFDFKCQHKHPLVDLK